VNVPNDTVQQRQMLCLSGSGGCTWKSILFPEGRMAFRL